MKRLLLVPILLLAFSLPLYAQGVQLLDRVVAVVNDDVITERELAQEIQTVRQQLGGRGQALPDRENLARQVLERLVLTRIQLQLAEESGIHVDDLTLNNTLRNIAAGNGLSLQDFRLALQREGIDWVDFRNQIRNEITLTRLQKREVEDRVDVSEKEIDDFIANQARLAKRNMQYRLQHILVALPEGASPDAVQAAEAEAQELLQEVRGGADFARLAVRSSDGQQALEGGDLGWRTTAQLPALFVETVTQMQAGDISGPIRSPSGFHIIRLAETRGEERRIITETKTRHILIRVNEVVSDDQAREQLMSLRARIQAGEDFAELAKLYSEDPGSRDKGGDLGWVRAGMMVDAFEEVMFATPEGEVSAPFRSPFGWHILQVEGQRQIDDTEAYRRAQAQANLRERKAEEALELWLRRIRDEAYVDYRLPGAEG